MLLPWFLGALTLASGVLSMATRALEPGWCDVLLPAHVMTFGMATVIAMLIPLLPFQRDVRGRLVALLFLGIFSLNVAANMLGACATNPMAELDPVLQQWWHGYILEGLPVWKQQVSVALTLVWTVAIVLAGWWTAHRSGVFHQGRALACTLLFLFALAAGGYSLLVMREGVVAQLLAIPFAALLLAEWLPKARALTSAAPRILATLAVLGLATPTLASALGKQFDPMFPAQTMRPDVQALIERGECDYAVLASLDAGLVFAPLDAGPEILGRTDHAIVAASYHRNQRPMADVIGALTGPVGQAREVIDGYGADYVAACGAAADVALYRTAAEDDFANALVSGEVPEWLVLDDNASAGALRVYRVVR